MNKVIKVLLLFIVATSVAACSGNKQTDEGTTRVLSLTGSGEYNKSLFLSIVEQTEQDTSFLYTLRGAYNGDTVGFYLSMDKNIPGGIFEDGNINAEAGYQTGTIQFLRSGEESDRFITALATIWETEVANHSFSSEAVSPLVFSSNHNAVDFSKPSTNNFKLFFDLDAEEPGEIFFTHDTYHLRVEFQEKDPSFRQVIINSLSGVQTQGEE
ncbi:MAG TPA: hypothetical protein VKZ78_05025 [Sphingobacteriaceae bacterium]|nr:hypothetical protein [Sphingobacteriaceae bacterium]